MTLAKVGMDIARNPAVLAQAGSTFETVAGIGSRVIDPRSVGALRDASYAVQGTIPITTA